MLPVSLYSAVTTTAFPFPPIRTAFSYVRGKNGF